MIIFVTGADTGIGREIAGQLGALGHTVVIGAGSEKSGEQAAAELRADGADASSVVLDVSDQASVAAAAAALDERHDRLDALLNNAGVIRPDRPEQLLRHRPRLRARPRRYGRPPSRPTARPAPSPMTRARCRGR